MTRRREKTPQGKSGAQDWRGRTVRNIERYIDKLRHQAAIRNVPLADILARQLGNRPLHSWYLSRVQVHHAFENIGPSIEVAEHPSVTPTEILGSLNDIETKYAAKLLYFSGQIDLLQRGPRVSVVGSRKASAEGLRRAQSLSRSLAEHGIDTK